MGSQTVKWAQEVEKLDKLVEAGITVNAEAMRLAKNNQSHFTGITLAIATVGSALTVISGWILKDQLQKARSQSRRDQEMGMQPMGNSLNPHNAVPPTESVAPTPIATPRASDENAPASFARFAPKNSHLLLLVLKPSLTSQTF